MKRYDLEDTASRMSYQTAYELVEHPGGEWVRYEDVEPLIARARELLREVRPCDCGACMTYANLRKALAKLGETP